MIDIENTEIFQINKYTIKQFNKSSMNITFISDTHGMHDQLQNLVGEVIVHAGDVSGRGGLTEIEDFLNWFKKLDFKYRIFIAGNHDFYFENAPASDVAQLIPEGVIYLNDSGVSIEGIKFWGSPVQPEFYNWAFNRKRGVGIKKHWDLIPAHTDILITHGPPMNILDKTTTGLHVGCEELQDAVLKIKPKIHVFGHIHEAYGWKEIQGIQFINASVLNERYALVNAPIEHSVKS